MYTKSLIKAAFLGQIYNNITNPVDGQNLTWSYDEWRKQFQDYTILTYNLVLQQLDLKLEVVYPIDYINQAIPSNHPFRGDFLAMCQRLPIESQFWIQLINESLFKHPREIAI